MSFPAPLSLLYVKKNCQDHSPNQLCSASPAGNSESKAGSQEQEAAAEKQQEKLKPELHPEAHDGKEEDGGALAPLPLPTRLPETLCGLKVQLYGEDAQARDPTGQSSKLNLQTAHDSGWAGWRAGVAGGKEHHSQPLKCI